MISFKTNLFIIVVAFLLGMAFAVTQPVPPSEQQHATLVNRELHNVAAKSSSPLTKHKQFASIPETQLREDGISIDDENYDFKLLASGLDGDVYRAENLNGKGDLAVKISKSKVPNFRLQSSFREEAHILRRLDQLAAKMTTVEKGNAVLPMKFIDGETQLKILDNPKFQNPDDVLNQVNAIDDAIKEMQSKGIEHRDIHAGNIMYEPETKKATLIDFGRSATSFVTDENGNKINLTPYGDRVRFLEYMLQEIEFMQYIHPQMDFSKVVHVVTQKLVEARNSIKISDSEYQKLKELRRQKLIQWKSLFEEMPGIFSMSDEEIQNLGKKELSEIFPKVKEMKRITRELNILDTTIDLKDNNLYGNQNEIWKLYRTYSPTATNFINGNEERNIMFDNVHRTFQTVKKTLKDISSDEQNSEEDLNSELPNQGTSN